MPYGRSSYGRKPTSRGLSKGLARRAYAKGFFAAGPKGEGTFTRGVFGADYKSATPAQRLLRRAVPYKGRGAYWGKALGGWAGGRMAAITGFDQLKDWGEKAGDWASDKAQDFAMSKIRKITGQGRYSGMGEYKNNALIVGGEPSLDIKGNTDETDTITLRNMESMFELYAPNIAVDTTSSFNVQKFSINPGLFEFSRKLSAIAKNYTQYEIKQMVFEIRSLVSESSINNGLTGSVLAAVNYDPFGQPPDNKDEFMDMSGAVSGRITDNLNVGVECDPIKTNKVDYLVRTMPVPINRDIDEFDHGTLFIATNNLPDAFSNQAIAEVFVYYTIELRMWKPNRDILKEVIGCKDNRTQGGSASSQSGSADFATNTVAFASLNNIGITYGSAAITGPNWFLQFPPTLSGSFETILKLEGTSLVNGALTVSYSGNVTPINDMFASDQAVGDNPSSYDFLATTTGVFVRVRYRVRTAVGSNINGLSLQLASLTGTVTQWVLETTEYSLQMAQSTTNRLPKFVDNTGTREIIMT